MVDAVKVEPSSSNKRSAEDAGLSSNGSVAGETRLLCNATRCADVPHIQMFNPKASSRGQHQLAGEPSSIASIALLPNIRSRIDALLKSGQVHAGDLDDRVLEKLSTVTEEGGMVVLTQFEHALSNGSIRNKSAYLNGVIKSHQVANRMQPDLNSRLSDLYKTDKLNGQELDARCMDHLGSLTPQLANRALDAFLSKDLSSARNVSALFMSTLRQLEHNAPVEHNQYASNPQSRAYGGRDNGGGVSSYGSGRAAPQHTTPYLAVYDRPIQGDTRQSQNRDVSAVERVYGRPPPIQMGMTHTNTNMRDSGAGHLKNYSAAQSEYRVRVDEFHALSPHAVHVHPAAAFRLQDLWDRGGKLVSLLDDQSWLSLVHLPPAEQLSVIDEVHEKTKTQELRNVNALFTSICKHLMNKAGVSQAPSYGRNGDSHRDNNQFAPPAAHFSQSGSRGGFQQSGPPINSRDSRPPPPGAVSGSLAPGSDEHIQMLPPPLRDEVMAMLRNVPHLKPHHIDEPIVEKLNKMSQPQAFEALAELARNNLGTVRNIPAYIMGIIKRTNGGGGPVGARY